MNDEIIIPSLGESITEATIVKLLKKSGDSVEVDDIILELETEKVNIEVSAQVAGVIEGIEKKEGDNVLVGEVIGKINPKNMLMQSFNNVTEESKSQGPIDNSISLKKHDVNDSKNNTDYFPPSVNRLLKENNIDPKTVTGTGKRGMLTKQDVLESIENSSATYTPTNTYTSNNNSNNQEMKVIIPVRSEGRSEERVRMSRLRQTIAKRLKDSQNTAAILTTFNEINMSKVIGIRNTYKDEFEKKYNSKLGFMSFFVKAVVEALRAIPAINAEIQGDEIVYKNYYDIGVAVGGSQGLVVPVIRNCQNLTFAQIETEIVQYSTKARTGKLALEDLTGGTFSISNGGVYGSLLSTPIINPPQSGILGLHKIEERPIVVSGKIEIRSMMYVALSYDHRIIDGKDAVEFLVRVKNNIENPERLLLNV